MEEPGLIHAFLLSGAGGAQPLTPEEARLWRPEDGVLWLHFNRSAPETLEWINSDERLDEVSRESLLLEETRPRATTINNTLLLAMRGVNLNPDSDPEDMVAVRLWADQQRIITTLQRPLLSIRDIVDAFAEQEGPSNTSEMISNLADRLVSRMSGTVDNIEDRLADLEERILEVSGAELRQQLSAIRREAIVLRRYLAPQREAMVRLYGEKISWLTEADRLRLRETTDQLIRYIEDLDSIRDRATVIHEELANNLSEQMNKRMYVLSLAAGIFLPLSFLTGLFGINVGGIPGAESKAGFALFISFLFVVIFGLVFFLKNKKWL